MAGFFGKIPGHGDFVTRELPRGFVDAWDEWLQHGIVESKGQLQERWLDVYLTSPMWRFGIVAGLCGPEGWAGILMPSVDRVGRYFPLTIAVPLPPGVGPLQLPGAADAWFDAIEPLALRTLEDDKFDANALQRSIDAIPPIGLPAERAELSSAAGDAWSLVVLGSSGAGISRALAATLIARETPLFSLWWTPGSENVPSAALVVAGMPDPQCFVDLLHGTFSEAAMAAPPPADAQTGDGPGATW